MVKKCQANHIWMDLGWVRKNISPEIKMGKIFETNSSIYIKQRTMWKVQIEFSRSFQLAQKNFPLSDEHLKLGIMKILLIFSNFNTFLILSNDPKSLCILYYTMFIRYNHASFLLWYKKYQNIMTMIVCPIFFWCSY